MELSHLLKNVHFLQTSGDVSGEVSSVCYDSRKCRVNSLFVAVSGLKSDGHDYIEEAVARGARFIVHEKDIAQPAGITTIKVENARRILGILSKNFYRDPSSHICLIGVTGTNGKTTVTYLLESIFRAAGFSVGVMGTVNYRFKGKVLPAPNTTPESLDMQEILRDMVNEGVTHVIAEVSSHALDLRRIDDCGFDLGIFTNLSQDHLDYHKTLENYFQAKKRFFEEVLPAGGKGRMPAMIINMDDRYGQKLISEVGIKPLTYGIRNKSDVMAERFSLSVAGIEADVKTEKKSFTINSGLIGKFNLYNILAAVTTSLSLGLTDDTIRDGIKKLTTVPGRLEKVSVGEQPDVFVDYAHTEDALRRVLENLSEFKKSRIITVFGCGGDRDRAKRPLMGHAVAALSDVAIVTSDNPRTEDPLEIIREIEVGIPEDLMRKVRLEDLKSSNNSIYAAIPDRKVAIETAIAIAGSADIVLIAGKGHEDYQIIGTMRTPFDDRVIAGKVLAETVSVVKL